MDTPNVTIISAKTKPNTFFLFRDDGVEVELTLGKYLLSSKKLMKYELEYIRKHITKLPHYGQTKEERA